MKNQDQEDRYLQYRDFLHRETLTLCGFIIVFKRLTQRDKKTRVAKGAAPAFFDTVSRALWSVIITWVDKLLGKSSERGYWNYLNFIENNLPVFSVANLQQRCNLDSHHFTLRDRSSITRQTVEEDRKRIKQLPFLTSVKTRRDKFHAHFDRRYFFDRDQLQEDAPLKWKDLDTIMHVMEEVLNRYSSAFDNRVFRIIADNASDVDNALEILNQHEADRRSLS